MNKHFASPLKLLAVPAPGDVTTYQRLNDIELAAYGLWRNVIAYRDVPAFPINEGYRERRMDLIKEAIADMRKALGDE